MGDVYSVRDGDTDTEIPRQGAVRMAASVGWCELCACYRSSPTWSTMRAHGTPYAACGRHTPMDRALWEQEQV